MGFLEDYKKLLTRYHRNIILKAFAKSSPKVILIFVCTHLAYLSKHRAHNKLYSVLPIMSVFSWLDQVM